MNGSKDTVTTTGKIIRIYIIRCMIILLFPSIFYLPPHINILCQVLKDTQNRTFHFCSTRNHHPLWIDIPPLTGSFFVFFCILTSFLLSCSSICLVILLLELLLPDSFFCRYSKLSHSI